MTNRAPTWLLERLRPRSCYHRRMGSEQLTIRRLDVYAHRAEVSAPVVTSFASIPSRGMALLRLEDADGVVGWGEIWGNFPHITLEYRALLAGWALPSHVVGARVESVAAFTATVAHALTVIRTQCDEPGPVDSVLAALNQALWDLTARRAGKPLRVVLAPDAAHTVPVYASGLNPDDCVPTAATARAEGYRAFKLKIGFGDEVDQRNLERLREEMLPGERLFVDANQRWSLEQATRALEMLHSGEVDWLEEPMLADAPEADWRALAARTSIPLAGGENLRDMARFERSLEWLDFVQPDVGKWGGVDGCLAVARRALVLGRTYCPHWLSGGVGLAHSAQLLAAAGGDGVLEVDANENPLRSELIAPLMPLRDGCLELGDGPGIGIEPPIERLSQWQTHHASFT